MEHSSSTGPGASNPLSPPELTPLEQEVLDEYERLANNMKEVRCHTLTSPHLASPTDRPISSLLPLPSLLLSPFKAGKCDRRRNYKKRGLDRRKGKRERQAGNKGENKAS